MAKKPVKFLSTEEMEECKPLYIPGKPLMWVMSFGWAIVGYYVRHETPLRIRVAHANFFRNANKDYGRLAREGADSNCEWRYEGNEELSFQHIIRTVEFLGEVPNGPIRTG